MGTHLGTRGKGNPSATRERAIAAASIHQFLALQGSKPNVTAFQLSFCVPLMGFASF